MNVYVIEKNNMEPFEDYQTWVDRVYCTFRGASQRLLDDGFVPFYENIFGINDVKFMKDIGIDPYFKECNEAKILERELFD